MIAILKKFWMEEEGGESVEWPLVIALIAVGAIVTWAAIGDEVVNILTVIEEALVEAQAE